LNPDWDFFLEDSELPLDPLLQGIPTPEQLRQSSPEWALQVLRPYFPGAMEFWASPSSHSGHSEPSGYHDEAAPHVRQRGRLWISKMDKNRLWNWEHLEDFYVEASDADLKPQILDGLSAARKFPGFSSHFGNFRGLFIPKLCDVDVVRFRNGLLEFIRERLGPNQVVCAASQMEWMPEGLRFHTQGSLHNAKLRHGMLVFWTPRLSSWILAQAKKAEISPRLPNGVRLWEQWILHSREPSDPSVVGMVGDMAVWADMEGRPSLPHSQNTHRLSVLKSGPLIPLENFNLPQGGLSWASTDSFNSLSNLCHDFLRWERFTISALKTRALFEWNPVAPWITSRGTPPVWVIPACDGPLVNVVQVARSACDSILETK